jgi:ankyrin repeat protein
MEKGKRGTAKKGRVAKKREKEEEDRENEEEERKKQKVEEEEKEELNEEFLDACRYETLDEVKDVVERGAELLHFYENGKNGLHLACLNEDCEAGEEIVVYLVKKQKALLKMFDDKHWTGLHFAARYSSAKICEILIDNGCNVNGRNDTLCTPLILCCNRTDSESLKVAKLLIERGADLAKKTEKGNTALHYACLKGTGGLVQTLVDLKADVNVSNQKGTTALILATQNRLFGEKIVPVMIQAGADMTLKDEDGRTPLMHAFGCGGGKMVRELAPFVPEGCMELKDRAPSRNCPDPIGSMTEGFQFGFNPEIWDFDSGVKDQDPPALCWSMLRNGEFDITEIFQTLSESDNLDLWCYSATELWQRSAGSNHVTGETILHLAVKCKKLSPEDKIEIVQHILSFKINPLVLDNDNKRAIDYCTKEEKELHHILANYQNWKPEKKVMDWYGPYCRQRLRAFLLVEKRLQLGFPRDLKNLILSYVAEREYVWVPNKK